MPLLRQILPAVLAQLKRPVDLGIRPTALAAVAVAVAATRSILMVPRPAAAMVPITVVAVVVLVANVPLPEQKTLVRVVAVLSSSPTRPVPLHKMPMQH